MPAGFVVFGNGDKKKRQQGKRRNPAAVLRNKRSRILKGKEFGPLFLRLKQLQMRAVRTAGTNRNCFNPSTTKEDTLLNAARTQSQLTEGND